MGTRRGAQRQAESDAFEEANPFLTRVNTTLEVERSDEPFEPDDNLGDVIQIQALVQEVVEDPLGLLVPKVTQDLQPADVDVVDFWPLAPDISSAFAIETPVGFLLGINDIDDDGPGLFSSAVSMTDYGFGVISEEDQGDESTFALDGDEGLFFIFADDFFDIEVDEDGPFEGYDYPVGGIQVGVDYMALGGAGEVELFLFGGLGPEGLDAPVSTSGQVSEGDGGSFEGNLGGDLVFAALVTTTGSLEVALTGINLKTNFAGSLVDIGGDIIG